jgi:hypothetical protein
MNTYVVFCGDLVHNARKDKNLNDSFIVDDQNNEFLIFTFLKIADYYARFYNSRVIILMGNHELMEILEVADTHDPINPIVRHDRRKFVSDTTLTTERDESWNIHPVGDKDDESTGQWVKWYIRNTYVCVIINNLLFSHGGVKFDSDVVTDVESIHTFVTSPDYNVIVMNDIMTRSILVSPIPDVHGFYVDDVLYYFLNNRELGDYYVDKYGRTKDAEFTPRKCTEYRDMVRKFYENTLKVVFDDKRKLSSTNIKVIAGHNTQTEAKPECGYIYNIDYGLSRAFEMSIQKAMEIMKGELFNFIRHSTDIHKEDKLYLRKLFRRHSMPEVMNILFSHIQIDDHGLFDVLTTVIGKMYILNVHNKLIKWDLLKTRKSNGVMFCKSSPSDLDFEFCEMVQDTTFVSLLQPTSNSILYYLKSRRDDEYGHTLEQIERCVVKVEPNYNTVKNKIARMLNARTRVSADRGI